MAGKLWVRLMKRAKISRDAVVPCPDDDWEGALQHACHQLDVAAPMVVPKHRRDWEEFRQTRFTPDDFLEHLPADRMEVEHFDPDGDGGARRSQDPRNG